MEECKKTRRLIFDYMNGELSRQDWADTALHLHRCPSCRELVQTWKETDAWLKYCLVQKSPSPASKQNIMNFLVREGLLVSKVTDLAWYQFAGRVFSLSLGSILLIMVTAAVYLIQSHGWEAACQIMTERLQSAAATAFFYLNRFVSIPEKFIFNPLSDLKTTLLEMVRQGKTAYLQRIAGSTYVLYSRAGPGRYGGIYSQAPGRDDKAKGLSLPASRTGWGFTGPDSADCEKNVEADVIYCPGNKCRGRMGK